MQETLVWFLGQEDPWRRDRLPTPVFLGFPCGSAGKESACNAGDLGPIPALGRSPGRRGWLPTPIFWPGEFHGLYSPCGHRESDTTEWLALSPYIYIDRESEIFIMSDWLRSPRNFHLKVKWPWKLTVKFQTKSKGLWPKGASGMSPTQIWRPEKRKCWYPRGITFKEKVDVVTRGHFCSSFNSVLFCAHTGNNDLLYSLYWFKGKSIPNTIIYTTSSNVLPATRTFCGLVKWTFKLIITEEEEADGILFYWGYTKSTEWFEED